MTHQIQESSVTREDEQPEYYSLILSPSPSPSLSSKRSRQGSNANLNQGDQSDYEGLSNSQGLKYFFQVSKKMFSITKILSKK